MHFSIGLYFILCLAKFAFAEVETFGSHSSLPRISKKAPKTQKVLSEVETDKCSKSLHGIVYTPEVCAYKYLARITEEVKVMLGPVFFNMAIGNLESLISIASKYQLKIYVIPPYSYPVVADPNAVAENTFLYDAVMARNYLNFDGYVTDVDSQTYNYQFVLVSQEANLLLVRLSLPFENAPVGCECK